jgi:hypothetical protein
MLDEPGAVEDEYIDDRAGLRRAIEEHARANVSKDGWSDAS